VAYAGLTDEQRFTKQKAAHERGAEAHKKTAAALGVVGPAAWQIVRAAGGAAAFKDANAQETAALLEKGEGIQRDMTAARSELMDITDEAHQVETARFGTILSTKAGMEYKAIQKWLQNPPRTIEDKQGNALVTSINAEAIRAMATSELGRPIGDQEWVQMSQQAPWKQRTNARHMGAKLAAERATKIFEVLDNGPLQVALDYMTTVLRVRRNNEMKGKRGPQKKKK